MYETNILCYLAIATHLTALDIPSLSVISDRVDPQKEQDPKVVHHLLLSKLLLFESSVHACLPIFLIF